METFDITRISETKKYPIITKKVKQEVCALASQTIVEAIKKFVTDEGLELAKVPNPIANPSPHNYIVLVKMPRVDVYDLWTLIIMMDLTLPLVASGAISYPDDN